LADINADDFMDISNEHMQDARFAVGHITASALSELAEVLREKARSEKSKTLHGLSILSGMAGKTGLGALELYHAQNWYAGAALTRQLVEHHYLSAYFARDLSRVDAWLDADERQLRNIFSPSKVREAGGFTKADYSAHCTWGGHPNPRGTWLVAKDMEIPRSSLLLIDLAQHLKFIYSEMVKCIGEGESSLIPGMLVAYNYIVKWQAVDPYAHGLPVAAGANDAPAPPRQDSNQRDM
jgi:hypothetical protein